MISGFTWTVAANSMPDAIKYFVQLLWDVFMMKLLRCTGSGHTQKILVQCRGCMTKHPYYHQCSLLLQYSASPLCFCIVSAWTSMSSLDMNHMLIGFRKQKMAISQHVFPPNIYLPGSTRKPTAERHVTFKEKRIKIYMPF